MATQPVFRAHCSPQDVIARATRSSPGTPTLVQNAVLGIAATSNCSASWIPFASTSIDSEAGFPKICLASCDKRGCHFAGGSSGVLVDFFKNRGAALCDLISFARSLGECFRVKSACGDMDFPLDVSSGFQVIL